MGVPGHEGFGQEVQGRPVDDYFRAPDGIDQRAAGGVAQHIDLPTLGPV